MQVKVTHAPAHPRPARLPRAAGSAVVAGETGSAHEAVQVAPAELHYHAYGQSWRLTQPQQVAVGAGAGAALGLGVGMVAETLRAVAPKSAVVFSIGCALVGAGLGGAYGGGVVSGVHGNWRTGAFAVDGLAKSKA